MHVLHRPHLPHAAAITAVCAALALALTLLLSSTLNDLRSSSPSGSLAATPVSVHSTLTERGWNPSPFASLLRSPVPVSWSAGSK